MKDGQTIGQWLNWDFKTNGNLVIKDKNNNKIYWESGSGAWTKREWDSQNREKYYEDATGHIIDNRIPEVIEGVDAAALSILGDFVPMGVGQSLGIRGGGNSLDNTLRIGKLVPTEWVLLDIRVHMVERGFGHGLVHMFAEDGTLMATASQSCIVRFWRDMPGPGPGGKAKD